MGFDSIAMAPIFAPGDSGDVFLTGDVDRAHPAFETSAGSDEVAELLAAICRQNDLNLILDIVVDQVDPRGELARSRPDLFATPRPGAADPRVPLASRAAQARLDTPDQVTALADFWRARLRRLLDAGVRGFRFIRPQALPAPSWNALLSQLRAHAGGLTALAWTPGLARHEIAALSGAGFDGVFSSVAWWDHRAAWFVEEHAVLRAVAPVLGCPEVPFGRRLAETLGPGADVVAAYRRALRVVAASLDGIMVPMGFERADGVPMDPRRAARADLADARHGPAGQWHAEKAVAAADISSDVRAANDLVDRLSAMGSGNALRSLGGSDDDVAVLLRLDTRDPRTARRALAIVVNADATRARQPAIPLDPLPPSAGAAFSQPTMLGGKADVFAPLGPAEVRLIDYERTDPVRQRARPERQVLAAAVLKPRIVIEHVAPAVDDGRYAVKRLVGERLAAEADIYADGHGTVAADLLWKSADATEWHRLPMRPGSNDRWSATFTPARVGRHSFVVEAWADDYGTLCRDIDVKAKAGIDCSLERDEALHQIETAFARAEGPNKEALIAVARPPKSGTEATAAITATARSAAPRHDPAIETLLAQPVRDAMRAVAPRHFVARQDPIIVDVERPQAGIGAWYELFPRSAAQRTNKHGTFDDVISLLPGIRAMGFDVLYFPPIHPIGTTHRKGRNNSLVATADDPGSPYAIGSRKGGHDAIHPELGTFEDFARLIAAAVDYGLEIALDFAVQCSPDHPWLEQHRDWFLWQTDGSIRYAENPPKKYEDIVNVAFYADGAGVPDLWIGLRDIVLFWIGCGIRIFRVDNPHTKPLPFWQWMIQDVRTRHADAIFLAEAFTRPKMMHRLAKIGFSQSYTYFTWRNTKPELIEYLTELSNPPVCDYFRPNFFVNTPDINPYFLQTGGRPAFLIRAALAATLSPLWGMYSGFELCEAAPLPGREEYLDSEKYEIKTRDHDAPGNIVAEIARLNRIRQAHPALQRQVGLSFCTAYNDQILVYARTRAGHRDCILIAVSLDPFAPQEAAFELPLQRLGQPDHAAVQVEDLMGEHRFVWTGKMQRVRLDPARMPFAIWQIAPLSEHAA